MITIIIILLSVYDYNVSMTYLNQFKNISIYSIHILFIETELIKEQLDYFIGKYQLYTNGRNQQLNR